MNWIENMNNALEYIEENIENDITSDDIAKIAYSSKFHFLRLFNVLTGMTLGDYIRQRRLSLAAKDIMSSNMKIIDISYKYGYETPEAFTKAFKKLHGISPSKARKKDENLKAIPPISFQISVKGEKRMDYKIIEKKEFKIAGISRRVTSKNGENFNIIPKFWDEICSNGTCEKLNKSATELGTLGVCYGADKEQEEFSYMIGIEGDNIQFLENYEVLNVPDCTWAVFESIGPMPHAIQKVWHSIFAEWFPATKYEHADAPELEVYLPGNPNADDYKCEVWIPVVEKSKK
jgi:AraC family transcriptional regulator